MLRLKFTLYKHYSGHHSPLGGSGSGPHHHHHRHHSLHSSSGTATSSTVPVPLSFPGQTIANSTTTIVTTPRCWSCGAVWGSLPVTCALHACLECRFFGCLGPAPMDHITPHLTASSHVLGSIFSFAHVTHLKSLGRITRTSVVFKM